MRRRSFIKKSIGVASVAAVTPLTIGANINTTTSIQDGTRVIVIGAGVFGVWTAFYLQELGAKVTLVDAYGPGNSRSSSGGESRILRADYGERLMYSRLNIRAHELWDQWQKEWNRNIMYPTGRLTLGNTSMKGRALKTQERMKALDIPSEVLDRDELEYRWPQINYEDLDVGLYFPGGAGGSTLMAGEACRLVAEKFVEKGGTLTIAKSVPGDSKNGKMEFVLLNEGERLPADLFVFACGPWMAKVFPGVLGDKLKVFRRDVLFVGSKAGDSRYAYPNFPVWIFTNPEDQRYYGMPDIHGHGVKVAPWPDNNSIDMDTDERLVNPNELKRVHEFVARRFPGLKGQPILETRVCQLTLSSDAHFIVDRHPELSNVWFVCAGSGHGFKHGPALGEYVARRTLSNKSHPEYDEAFRLK